MPVIRTKAGVLAWAICATTTNAAKATAALNQRISASLPCRGTTGTRTKTNRPPTSVLLLTLLGQVIDERVDVRFAQMQVRHLDVLRVDEQLLRDRVGLVHRLGGLEPRLQPTHAATLGHAQQIGARHPPLPDRVATRTAPALPQELATLGEIRIHLHMRHLRLD